MPNPTNMTNIIPETRTYEIILQEEENKNFMPRVHIYSDIVDYHHNHCVDGTNFTIPTNDEDVIIETIKIIKNIESEILRLDSLLCSIGQE